MDKYEYKLKLEQLKNLVQEKDYKTAAKIADTINWRKVKSAATLCMVGEIYDRNKRYEDSREILLMAYDRATVGRNILYRLTLVALKMGNIEEAKEYYEEFLEVAPYDNLKYVLRYQIAKLEGADLPELIGILEEFKEREYTEDWAFELAYLYHRAGNSERCVEVCDELVLWFGDGKYVEKALELKMLYQPLNKQQEEKYRQFKMRREGVVEVRPTDMLESGEIIRETIQIPDLAANPGRFNTTNLQEELAKSMQQILDANTKETVSDTMDNIKKMVEEIPYLQMPQEEEEAVAEEERYGHIETDEEIDGSLKTDFKEMLAEDRDGQIRLSVPGGGLREPQVNGQMRIEEVLAEWEKTRRAAETAMAVAQQRKLESAKARALQEAEELMERLNAVIPKLEAGVSPQELLAERYLQNGSEGSEWETEEASKIPYETDPDEITPEELEAAGREWERFSKEAGEMGTEGFAGEVDAPGTEGYTGEINAPGTGGYTGEINTPELEGYTEEINALGTEGYTEEINAPELDGTAGGANDALQGEYTRNVNTEDLEGFAGKEHKPEAEEFQELSDTSEREISSGVSDQGQSVDTIPERPSGKDAPRQEKIPEVSLEELIEQQAIQEPVDKQEKDAEQYLESVFKAAKASREEKHSVPRIENIEIETEEEPITRLSEEQKEIFSYFVPVTGMEQQLCQVLEGALHRKGNDSSSASGNILITGGRGSGKTVLATDIIKAIQKSGKHPAGKVGKITGDSLNQKDLSQLLKKVAGGYLIIEQAGEISQETVTRLSLLMEQNTNGLLIIMEDTRKGIDKVLSRDVNFAKKFTERIKIPVFTSDELVEFAKAYATEQECEIDDMGILALYNRISNIQKLDEATTLTEVKEIVDEAISSAERGGLKKLFGGKKFSPEGYLYLREKDFEN